MLQFQIFSVILILLLPPRQDTTTNSPVQISIPNRPSTAATSVSKSYQSKWLKDDQIYLGIRVMNKITQPEFRSHITATKEFFHRCRYFLIPSAKEIKKGYDLDDPILSKIYCIEPTNAASSYNRNKLPTLQLMILVPRIVKLDDIQLIQAIDDKWCSFSNILDKISMHTDEFGVTSKNNLRIFIISLAIFIISLAQFALNLLFAPF